MGSILMADILEEEQCDLMIFVGTNGDVSDSGDHLLKTIGAYRHFAPLRTTIEGEEITGNNELLDK